MATTQQKSNGTMQRRQTHYETLGVAESADASTIKEAFRALVLQHHPDKQSSPTAASHPNSNSSSNDATTINDDDLVVHEITKAYHVLRDAAQRKAYDEGLRLTRQRRHDRLASAIVLECADCVEEEDENDDGTTTTLLVYPCRCGIHLDTSPLEEDGDDQEHQEYESGKANEVEEEDGLLECPGCSLVYDTRKLNPS